MTTSTTPNVTIPIDVLTTVELRRIHERLVFRMEDPVPPILAEAINMLQREIKNRIKPK